MARVAIPASQAEPRSVYAISDVNAHVTAFPGVPGPQDACTWKKQELAALLP